MSRQRFFEEATLFVSVTKWTIYASVVGIVVGLATAVFLKILQWTTEAVTRIPFYFLLLPVAFVLSAVLIRTFAPEAEGHGTEKVIEAVHQRMGAIAGAVVPIKLLATVITLAPGGSVGKEGPCAQIGAGLASALASLFRISEADRRKLVICGISAGFATVFGTPIAGSLFGVEVLFLGQIMYDVLFPSFVAGITSYYVSKRLGVSYFNHPLPFAPQFSEGFFLKSILVGVICGLVAFLLIEMLELTHRWFNKLRWWKPWNGLVGGGLLIIMALALSPRYLGLGLDGIEQALTGKDLPTLAFFWKTLATSISLGSGGSGGIITPIFFIGAATGNLVSRLFEPQYAPTIAAIGMVALVAGAANTPIAASVMSMEMFGAGIAPYSAIACVVSFVIVGHRSVYPSQILAMHKSGSISLTEGKPVGEVDRLEMTSRHLKGLIGLIDLLRNKIKQRPPGGKDDLPGE